MVLRVKQFVSIGLFLAGLAMVLYGHVFHVVPVFSQDNDRGLGTAEPAIVKEVSIGGLELKEDGKLFKTYTGAPPKACPT